MSNYHDIDEELGALDAEIGALEDDMDDDDEVGLFRRRRGKRQRRKARAQSIRARGGQVRKIRVFKPGRVRKGAGFFGRGDVGRPGPARRKRRVVVRRPPAPAPRPIRRVVVRRPPGVVAPSRPLGVPLGWSQPVGAPGWARPGVPSFRPAGGFDDEYDEYDDFGEYDDFDEEGAFEDDPFGEPGDEVEYVDEFGQPIDPFEFQFAGIDEDLDYQIAALENELTYRKKKSVT